MRPRFPANPWPIGLSCRLQKFLGDLVEKSTADPCAAPWLGPAAKEADRKSRGRARRHRPVAGAFYETFRKEFTRRTGQPPGRYRLHRLIDQARALITGRGLSNKQLAEPLGFCDEFHLSRRFRQITGQITRDFRRMLVRPR